VGLSFARRLAGGGGVVGADLSLRDLSAAVARERVTRSTKISIYDDDLRVIALSESEGGVPLVGDPQSTDIRMPRLSELDDPVFRALADQPAAATEPFELAVDGDRWLSSTTTLPTRTGEAVYLATLIPQNELLAHVNRVRNRSFGLSLALLAATIGLVFLVSRGISGSLRRLAVEAEQIRRFKLARPVAARSRIIEVDELAHTMAVMKSSLQQFFEISRALAAEKDQKRLLEMILREARKVSNADGGAVLMETEDETRLEVAILENERADIHLGGTSGVEPPFQPVAVVSDPDAWGRVPIDGATAARGVPIHIEDVGTNEEFDLETVHARFDSNGYEARSLLSVPLADQKGEFVGLLQLVNARSPAGEVTGFDPEVVPYIEALSADAAVALDLRRLLKAQKDLLESFIHVVAGAIDAKSPYTHGHCQRVPEIARTLAEAAHSSEEGPFAEFHLTDDEWYELHIASWLHDCGKVTTPEYVVDKATRLETIYNRIHEVRTRFEVLWRDAWIAYYKALVETPEDRERHWNRLEARLHEIRSDFEFVAECNSGETLMDEDRTARLRSIGAQTWKRHLNDRIGLSDEELRRKQRRPAPQLPVTEPLLGDKVEHVIERAASPFGDNRHGFKMEVPENLYNLGEIHNLSVTRGTLTDEERFKINEHIVQTIDMLGKLPFPKELRRVPEWAGNHHEKLDGTGYPRRLAETDLEMPERIMAIADVFEALTAADRPYKPPKTLSQSLKIMSFFRDGGHICPDLFELFLTSGVYLDYANRFLEPEQIDDVHVAEYLRR
jgi:HD-GYP domain-containing protein (c-di-GMP phosphodiesterase class II)